MKYEVDMRVTWHLVATVEAESLEDAAREARETDDWDRLLGESGPPSDIEIEDIVETTDEQ